MQAGEQFKGRMFKMNKDLSINFDSTGDGKSKTWSSDVHDVLHDATTQPSPTVYFILSLT